MLAKLRGYWSVYRRSKAIREVVTAPDRGSYSDIAIAPPRENEDETLDLYHATRGGEDALARRRRDDAIRTQTERKTAAVAAE